MHGFLLKLARLPFPQRRVLPLSLSLAGRLLNQQAILSILLAFWASTVSFSSARAAALPVNSAQGGLLLARNGQALVPLVISENASQKTKDVAKELAQYLQKMSGASFAIETGDGSHGIVLGTLAQFPDRSLEKPLEVRNGFDGKEAFVIRTEPKRLRLIGTTELGASHAAFALLEASGCRWFFQAPEWEVIPSTPALRVNLQHDDRPAILARRIWYGGGFFERERDSRPVLDYAAWGRHNRMAHSFNVQCQHSWQTIIAQKKAAFQEHPEYLAWTGGKRQGEQFCVSNPGLRQLVVEWALAYLKKNPAADMVSMEPSDGGGQCECGACRKLGTISDRVFGLANEVARAVAREFPGKLVGLYAYHEHSEPPDFALEPNVYVQLTAGFTRGRYSFEELLEEWPRKCKKMGFYEYFSVWPWDYDQFPGGRANDTPYLHKQIPLYAQRGATSLDCESSANFGIHGRGYYIAEKLMWNPKADVDALLADFYDKAFEPAAAPMRRYYERFDRGNKPLVSAHLLALGFRDVEEASRLAANRPDVQARLDQIKHYLRSVQLRWQVDRATIKEKKKELTLAAITQGYRTRYSYMTHFVAIRGAWASDAAKEFNEPSWSPSDPTPHKPWAVDRPYTHEETETEFREGLAFFQPDPVEEKQFTQNLIPVNFTGSTRGAPVPSVQTYQWTLPYALYSVSGEALDFNITPGTIVHYRDMAPAKWSITNAFGKRIANGRLPLDGKRHPVTVQVPEAGLYFLAVDDSTAGWRIEVAPGRPASVMMEPARRVEHAGWMQPMYFYVPKGTRELQYFWAGKPHRLHGPDGAVLKEVKTNGEFVKVSVPPGADGKTWHFSQLMLGSLWLFNAPNNLAASPAALLVPKELADQDGLSPRIEHP